MGIGYGYVKPIDDYPPTQGNKASETHSDLRLLPLRELNHSLQPLERFVPSSTRTANTFCTEISECSFQWPTPAAEDQELTRRMLPPFVNVERVFKYNGW